MTTDNSDTDKTDRLSKLRPRRQTIYAGVVCLSGWIGAILVYFLIGLWDGGPRNVETSLLGTGIHELHTTFGSVSMYAALATPVLLWAVLPNNGLEQARAVVIGSAITIFPLGILENVLNMLRRAVIYPQYFGPLSGDFLVDKGIGAVSHGIELAFLGVAFMAPFLLALWLLPWELRVENPVGATTDD